MPFGIFWQFKYFDGAYSILKEGEKPEEKEGEKKKEDRVVAAQRGKWETS